MSLFVSRNPIKRCNNLPTKELITKRVPDKSVHPTPDKLIDPVVVRIDAQRGIIKCGGVASLNFLLSSNKGPRSFDVSLHDVFIGDDSKYVQVIWMYNHSQKDVRYWAEWLLVNNKVFKILNSRARVSAYSLYPLFIEFTPFEIKTYKSKLAVVDELGDEFHISIEARGSICPDLSPIMLTKKMPIDSYFEDQGADIELFPSHIVLSPMTTHSYDKYIFFMKNHSKEIICFSWERVVVWSTVQVMVQPREGELQPGEIFPLQMLVHTFRNSAIINFLVECIYYNKTKFYEYWKKCRILEKTTKTFDTCFTYLPDKEIEIAYHNPVRKLFAGDAPMNKIVSLGASLRIFNRDHLDATYPTLSQQLKFLPPPRIELGSQFNLNTTHHKAYYVAEILKVIMMQVVMSNMFKERIKRKRPALRYVDFLDKRGSPQKRNLPGRQMGMLLATLLDGALMRLFGFEPAIYHDICIPVIGKVHQEIMFKMYNGYYEHMLRNGIDQMCIPPENVRVKRTTSRDHLAFVQRISF
uniref:CFAP65 tenth Ig-like domain-containing protein n=2 Tax=Lygus hesperus TaxID=30085 RepID=A0A0A9XXH0_LYGHE